MPDILAALVPPDRLETAQAALTSTFGSAPIKGLAPVIGGASGALTYRLELGGRSYLLRMEGQRTAFHNPHQYACMQTASDAGLAPPLRHVDARAGVAIMDFIAAQPLETYPGGPAALVGELGGLAARLQATPPFPALGTYPDLLARMLGFIRNSGLFAPGLLDPHAEGFERLRQAYGWDASALVSAHNDPNPRNILFDGQRLWLIDWETAYRNDTLTDMAILAENFAATPELETLLLRAWLGREPDRVLHARLTLMRVMTRLYYVGLIFSGFAATPPAIPDADLTAPDPEAFRLAAERGEITPGSRDTLYLLGKLCLAGFLAGLKAPGFEEALVIAREG
ncbi:MAG: phosphotransferase [Phenylobacterium sp.]|nr:phosphotransferase [Phenylobacterium sp.]